MSNYFLEAKKQTHEEMKECRGNLTRTKMNNVQEKNKPPKEMEEQPWQEKTAQLKRKETIPEGYEGATLTEKQ